jgi:hypothetical protein
MLRSEKAGNFAFRKKKKDSASEQRNALKSSETFRVRNNSDAYVEYLIVPQKTRK